MSNFTFTDKDVIHCHALMTSWGEVYQTVKLCYPAWRPRQREGPATLWSCRVKNHSDITYRGAGATWVEAVLKCEARMAADKREAK